jgi:hypothetical protein
VSAHKKLHLGGGTNSSQPGRQEQECSNEQLLEGNTGQVPMQQQQMQSDPLMESSKVDACLCLCLSVCVLVLECVRACA